MVSLETGHPPPRASDAAASSPRISFSAEFLDEKSFISISPKAHREKEREMDIDKAEFEFLSTDVSLDSMLSADELFCEGKLLPFWQMQQSERLNKISLGTKDGDGGSGDEERRGEAAKDNKEQSKANWFLDDDPSPRPPKCTVLWKELLRLKKQRANSSLSPSSSSSSTSSSSNSMADAAAKDEKKEAAATRTGEKQAKRIRKGLERTRSASIRIRPMVNVPICTPAKSSTLPPLFPLKKGRLDR
ncbi:uncharacterized protein LOC115753608 [Rhodamnia argentea]|uniref:Uncharacterized protein LOC115753608 n=1 Tax=Rhodamnia argentea TaxID=178133 RepID=A0A8B8QPF3_9MYRT|nr:uncharacterized protein LOC115753608 [Rhodamnia argentea]